MRAALMLAGLLLVEVFLRAAAAAPSNVTRSNYLLGCGGCHGYEGISNSKLVPTLKGLVGYYLNTAEGRDYLPRLPNVAFSTLNDQDLAAVLNYLVFDLGGSSAPRGARPYAATEVGRLRKHPLTEIALHPYRRQLVDALISRYRASDALRVYDVDLY